jgi:hypothetical protein
MMGERLCPRICSRKGFRRKERRRRSCKGGWKLGKKGEEIFRGECPKSQRNREKVYSLLLFTCKLDFFFDIC